MDLRIDHVVHATGSTGTQAGLLVGLGASNSGIPVYGVSVRANKQAQQDNVWKLVQATVAFLKLPQGSFTRAEGVAHSDSVGTGFVFPTDTRTKPFRPVG